MVVVDVVVVVVSVSVSVIEGVVVVAHNTVANSMDAYTALERDNIQHRGHHAHAHFHCHWWSAGEGNVAKTPGAGSLAPGFAPGFVAGFAAGKP